MDRNPKEMNDYILWSLVGGCIAFIVVLLSYMGFFSKVNCITSTTEEIILAYSNISAPYSEIDHQNRLLRDKLTAISPDVLSSEATIHIYYDDPRFPTDTTCWCVGCEVKKEYLDVLTSNNIHVVRIPPSTSLRVDFPYRNILSYGLGARKAFDTMVSTANAWKIKIATPPMEYFVAGSPTIQYLLYLENANVFQSMCEVPCEKQVI